MTAEQRETKITYQRLHEIINGFSSLRIAVVGDFFLDKWLEIDRRLDEISLETGLVAYQVVAKRLFAGAAGTILSNLSALGVGKLYAFGFTGDDGEGFELRRILEDLRVNIDALVVSKEIMTPTYTKPVFRQETGGEETHRLDHKNTRPTPAAIEDRIINSLRNVAPRVDAIIALDQLTDPGFGVLTPRVREELTKIALARPELVVYADSRSFVREFRGMIVKCNDIEAVKIFHPEAGTGTRVDLDEVGNCLLCLSELTGRPAFITCGEKGVLVQDEAGRPLLVPAIPQYENIDIVGAGDACTAGIVTTLCRGGSNEESAFVGNLISSITIQIIGTTGTAVPGEVLARYKEYYGKEKKG
jgi:bifunctional ADP-heptose synthase (sugar kinase/adenylyltransferase)